MVTEKELWRYAAEGLKDGLAAEPIPEIVEAVKKLAKENPWMRINDNFSSLCEKGGAEDGK